MLLSFKENSFIMNSRNLIARQLSVINANKVDFLDTNDKKISSELNFFHQKPSNLIN